MTGYAVPATSGLTRASAQSTLILPRREAIMRFPFTLGALCAAVVTPAPGRAEDRMLTAAVGMTGVVTFLGAGAPGRGAGPGPGHPPVSAP